jgi:hypothetical protein
MKVSEKKALEIHLDHDDIIDAIFEYILETNPEIADDWNTDEMEVELRVARNKPDGGGVELRGIVKSAVSLMKDTKTPDEPVMPENERVKEGDIDLGDINWDTGQHP